MRKELEANAAAIHPIDLALHAVGIVDHALLALLQLGRLGEAPGVPRSILLALMQGHNQALLSARSRQTGELRLLATTAACMAGLIRGWREVLAEKPRKPSVPANRGYRVISLAVASLLIPWLMLRKR